ncbi:unnamed protein product, partial [Phaeothamnion confervicola]
EEVSGSDLLDQITKAIKRHCVLPEGRAEVMALWSIHAHAYDLADHSSFLALLSPEKRCGKTTALIVLKQLVPNGRITSNITASALYRATNDAACTLLFDEAERFLKNASFIGMINSSHARLGGGVDRT